MGIKEYQDKLTELEHDIVNATKAIQYYEGMTADNKRLIADKLAELDKLISDNIPF
ncbi:MAG: hypothetical protein WBO77_04445 [Microgenomates group bacterium]